MSETKQLFNIICPKCSSDQITRYGNVCTKCLGHEFNALDGMYPSGSPLYDSDMFKRLFGSK